MKFFLLLLAAAIAQSAGAQDTKTVVTSGSSGSAAPVSMCIGCHAIPGYQASFPYVYRVPKIGGQSQPYLEAALKAYRQGDTQSSIDDGGGEGADGSANLRGGCLLRGTRGQSGCGGCQMKGGTMKYVFIGAIFLAAVTSVAAQDAKKGEELAQQQCAACHGKDFVTGRRSDLP